MSGNRTKRSAERANLTANATGAANATVPRFSAACGTCGATCGPVPPAETRPAPAGSGPQSGADASDAGLFAPFRNWRLGRAEYARQWKQRTGGKVIGYFCTYAPEELMYAAGILPVRILGSHEVQDVTESHIFGMFCPFCRDCLA